MFAIITCIIGATISGQMINNTIDAENIEKVAIGGHFNQLGLLKEAIEIYRDCLSSSPRKLWIYQMLVDSMAFVDVYSTHEWKELFDEIEFAAKRETNVEDLAATARSIPGTVSTIRALAYSSEAGKQYATAWKYYVALNELESAKHDPELDYSREAAIAGTFNRDYFTHMAGKFQGLNTNYPIFIVGMPYSGSVQVEAYLDAHSQVFGFNARPQYYRGVTELVGTGLRNGVFNAYGSEIVRALEGLDKLGSDESIRAVANLVVDTMRTVAQLANTNKSNPDLPDRHSVDTELENYLLVGLIHSVFPNAAILNVVRDPLDVLVDCYRDQDNVLWRTKASRWGTNFSSLVERFTSYQLVMAHWRQVLPGRIFDVLYDDLVEDPKSALSPLLSQLGLEWETDMDLKRLVQSPDSVLSRTRKTETGHWRRFAEEIGIELTESLREALLVLKAGDKLPFVTRLNWGLEPSFPSYPTLAVRSKKKAGVAESGREGSLDGAAKRKHVKRRKKELTGKSNGRQDRKVKGSVRKNRPRQPADSEELNQLHDSILRALGDHDLSSELLLVPRLSGNRKLDEVVAVALSQLQQNQAQVASELCGQVAALYPDALSARLCLAAAKLNLGQAEAALEIFNAVIQQANEYDDVPAAAYTLRSQAYFVQKEVERAEKDLQAALALAPKDPEVWTERGKFYVNRGLLKLAHENFRRAKSLRATQLAYYYLVDTSLNMGNTSLALEYCDIALAEYRNFRPLWHLKLRVLTARGAWSLAVETADRIVEMDSSNPESYRLRGQLYHSIGRPAAALADDKKALASAPHDIEILRHIAVCHMTLGQMQLAVTAQSKILQVDPGHKVFYGREVTAYWWRKLHSDFGTFNIDAEMASIVRSGFLNELQQVSDVQSSGYRSLLTADTPSRDEKLVAPASAEELLRVSRPVGLWLHLNCVGFMASVRQMRAFGLAVLEMAQLLRRHVKSEGGVRVPHAGSSRGSRHWCRSAAACDVDGVHIVGYRDVVDIAVRWRQLADPNDAVFWFEFVPRERQGYMLTTHLVVGDRLIEKYAVNIPAVLRTLKAVMREKFFVGDDIFESSPMRLSSSQSAALQTAETMQQLYDLIGEGFWVIIPVEGVQGLDVLDGARLVLTKGGPSFEDLTLTIRTPSSTERLAAFETELEAAFQSVVSCLRSGKGDCGARELKSRALRLFFFWAHLSPLTRGTAATGYALICASLLAGGLTVNATVSGMPKNRQLDWEAMLSPRFADFLPLGLQWLDSVTPTGLLDERQICRPASSVQSCLDSPSTLDASQINTPAKALAVLATLVHGEESFPETPNFSSF